MLTPAPDQVAPFVIEHSHGVRIVRLKSPRTKDVNYVQRTLGEFLMPYAMLRGLSASPLAKETWDGVVWYSPSIFLGPLAAALKRRSQCRSYLIVRDIFPEWAVDMGLLGRGLPYRFFKAVERYQYSVADVIGVQTPGNLPYLAEWQAGHTKRHTEVLQNWLTQAPDIGCSINIQATPLAGRKIFVYAGNMGIAQGMGILLELAQRLQQRRDLGFVFVGRGSDAAKLRNDAVMLGLDNVAFFDEIDPDEIPGLYAQCHVGLVALDPRHKTHNIPGKFLSYMHCGLPALAIVNEGNDLSKIVAHEAVGTAVTTRDPDDLARSAVELLDRTTMDSGIRERCLGLALNQFSSQATVRQIVSAISSH